jgi:hypothetical protein
MANYPPYQQPLVDRTGHVSKPWQLFFLSLASGTSGVDSGSITGVPGSTGDVIYHDNGTLAAQPLEAFGYWTPITNGDPVTPEILFDSAGDCIVGFVPTP